MAMIGIDLGTTNSVLSIYKEDKPYTIAIDESLLLPSIVHLSDTGFIVGKTAKNLLILEPENTIASVKRKMGQDITLEIGSKKMRPEEVSAVILQKIKSVAAAHLGQDESEEIRAVITVPAYFSEEQRQATRQAADLAGLKTERIINEPTAAALAFGMSNLEEALYAVYDLGGGTFDVSIIESDKGLIEVLATTGNNNLGGDDFDEMLADFIWEKFKKTNKIKDLEADRRTRAKLLQAAENTKIALSSQSSYQLEDSFFLKHKDKDYHIEMTVSKTEFEDLIQEKIEETSTLLQKAISESKMKTTDLDGILLVGGSSRIPLVSQIIEKNTGILPQLIDLPDEAVAHGAAVQAAIIDGIDIKTILVDITPYSLGIAVRDDMTDRTFMAVSQLPGFDEDAYESDLANAVLIRKNTAIPAKNTERFYANYAFQDKFEIIVLQGENKRHKDNKTIGECLLEIEMPPENPEIDVTFKLDINGILELEAIETNTRQRVKTTFKSSRGQKVSQEKVFKQIEDEAIVLADLVDADNALIKRAEAMLTKEGLGKEDAEELEDLLARYQQEHLNGETETAEETKTEILELLYFLETK